MSPDPRNKKEYYKFLSQTVKTEEYDVLLPMGLYTNEVASKYKSELERYVRIPIAEFSRLKICTDKRKTIRLAKNLHVPIPNTLFPKNEKNLGGLAKLLKYPVVLKSPFEGGSRFVDYAHNQKELLIKFRGMVNRDERLRTNPPMIQEFIKGVGCGFFGIYDREKCQEFFMHRRLRELPINGGASTCAESIYNQTLKEYGLRILNALNWHGVAMVEFKYDIERQDFYLMEINAKFWGSLDLAIAAGVDFPFAAVKIALGDNSTNFKPYKLGLKFIWILPDLQRSIKKRSPRSIARSVFDIVNPAVRKNICLYDVLPFLVNTLEFLRRLMSSKSR